MNLKEKNIIKLYLENDNKSYTVEVSSILEAREKFIKDREQYNKGASDYFYQETGYISYNDNIIANISYNGRVWSGVDANDNYDNEILPENFEKFILELKIPKEDISDISNKAIERIDNASKNISKDTKLER